VVRIGRTIYDADGQVTSVESAVDVPGLAQTTAAYSYSDNGQVLTLTEASGALTTYEHDGFDRLVTTRCPNPSGGGSSTTDYELVA
jgi:YD repeat-containing protein